MSAAFHEGALSREELSALLDSPEKAVTQRASADSPRPVGLRDLTGARAELAVVASRFAEEQGRSLSTLHQTSIGLRFSHWEEISLRQFATAMLESDRVAKFETGPQAATVYVLPSRPLLFRWLILSFGGGEVDPVNDSIPDRPYTRIEERFIRRAGEEIAHTLGKVLGTSSGAGAPEIALVSPAALFKDGKRPHLVASFEVTGLGEMSLLRIALPSSLLERRGEERTPLSVPHAEDMAAEVMEMPVEVGVQIGFTDLSLDRLSRLRPGDELPLKRLSEDGLLVRVEDKAKYLAQAGKIGSRVAVRITEVL